MASVRARTRHQAQEIYQAGSTYLKVYLLLSKLASDEVLQNPQADPRPPLWSIVPKVHYFHHQLVECLDTQLNSRHTHCFTDEDGMRYVKNLAKAADPRWFEAGILKAGLMRIQLTGRKSGFLNRESARRSRPVATE